MAVAYRATRGLDGHGCVCARRRQQSDGVGMEVVHWRRPEPQQAGSGAAELQHGAGAGGDGVGFGRAETGQARLCADSRP